MTLRHQISVEEIWPDIPIELRKWIVKHVATYYNPKVPFGWAMTTLMETGYSIEFGPRAYECTSSEREMLVLHEIQHIIRGDVLHQWKHRDRPEYNPALWNLTADAVINNKGLVDLCGPKMKELIVTFSSLKAAHMEQLGHFDLNPGTKPLYDALLPEAQKQEREMREALKKLLESGGCTIGPLKADAKANSPESEIRHLEAILDLPKGFSISPPQIRDKVKAEVTSNMPLPKVARMLHQWLRRWKICGDTKVRTRSWLRESRLFPDSPGYLRLPTAKLVLALDVSGSMQGLYKELWAATNWLRKFGTFGIEVWVWADAAAKANPSGEHPDVGGGTALEELYRHAPRCDVMVVFTDGYFSSGLTPPSRVSRILWILSDDGARDSIVLRDRDSITTLKDKTRDETDSG